MRELTDNEVKSVSGGFVGTPIPFFNGYIPGRNWPGGAPGFLGGISIAWNIGLGIGWGINTFNQRFSNMSLGEALHRTFNSSSVGASDSM